MAPNPDPMSAESEGSTLRSVRWRTDVFESALDLADRLDRSFSFVANRALREYVEREFQPAEGEPPDLLTWADNGWRVMQESGSSGKGYELSLTFSLPNMSESDQVCYEVREKLIALLSEAGGREIVTRLIGLGSMMQEKSIDAGEVHHFEPASGLRQRDRSLDIFHHVGRLTGLR